MSTTYLYQSSAVKNSMHVHIYLINMWHIYLIKKYQIFRFLSGHVIWFFSHQIKKSKNIKFDKKNVKNYQNPYTLLKAKDAEIDRLVRTSVSVVPMDPAPILVSAVPMHSDSADKFAKSQEIEMGIRMLNEARAVRTRILQWMLSPYIHIRWDIKRFLEEDRILFYPHLLQQ